MPKLPLDLWFEIGAFLIALLCYPLIKDKPIKWFIPFLFFIVVIELIGFSNRVNNTWLYIFTIPVEYWFYTFIFYHQYQNRTFRNISKWLLYVIPILAVVNIIVLHGIYDISRTKLIIATLRGGSFTMVVICCFYFIDLFQRDEEISLLRTPAFWIAVGLLFFNLVELPYNFFFKFILSHRSDPKAKLFIQIHKAINYVLYTFVSIGMICSKKPPRKT